jgi:hypothetical protein
MTFDFALRGLFAPAVFAGVLLLLAWVSRDSAEKASRGWLGALALGGAYLFGQAAAISGLPPFPPIQADDRLFWVVVSAVVLAAVEGLLSERWPLRFALRAGFACFAVWYLLARVLERRELAQTVALVAALGGALWLGWTLLAAWATRRPGASVPLVLWFTTSAVSVALLLSHTAKYAQMAGTLASCLGAAVVVSWVRPSFALGGGAAGIVAVLHASFCIAGVWLAATPLPTESALLLAAAPFLAAAAEIGPIAKLTPPRAVVARLVLVSLFLAPALFVAWVEAPPPSPY